MVGWTQNYQVGLVCCTCCCVHRRLSGMGAGLIESLFLIFFIPLPSKKLFEWRYTAIACPTGHFVTCTIWNLWDGFLAVSKFCVLNFRNMGCQNGGCEAITRHFSICLAWAPPQFSPLVSWCSRTRMGGDIRHASCRWLAPGRQAGSTHSPVFHSVVIFLLSMVTDPS